MSGRHEFRVDESRVEETLLKIETLNKRAYKLGVEPVAVFVSEMREEAVKVLENGEYLKRIKQFRMLWALGNTPKLAGWTLIGAIHHVTLEDGTHETIVATVPNQELDQKKYAGAGGTCDHCQTARKRNDTYVLRHAKEGEKRVGRNCLKDFLGGADPSNLIASATYEMEMFGLLEGAEGGGGGRLGLDRETFLYAVWRIASTSGFISRKKAEETGLSTTASRAMMLISDLTSKNEKVRAEAQALYYIADEKKRAETHADIEAATEWAAGHADSEDDYLRNLSVVARMAGLKNRGEGLLASLYAAWAKHKGMERRVSEWAEMCAKSQHFGEVGKRTVYDLTVTRVTITETDYGPMTVVGFIDGQGNAAVWFASGLKDFSVGQKLKVKATVKGHDEYKGLKQTILTRATIIEIPVTNPPADSQNGG